MSGLAGAFSSPLQTLRGLPRFWKRAILIAFDIVALSTALWASYSLRYGVWRPPGNFDQVAVILTAPLLALPIFVRMGLYRAVLRYLPERAVWTMLHAMTLAALSWLALAFLLELTGRGFVPRSVPILYWALGSICVVGSRFAAKRLLWRARPFSHATRPTVIYGAGTSGAQLAAALQQQSSTSLIGFLDDDRNLQGRDVAGMRVFSPAALPMLIEQYGVNEVIISIPSLSTAERQKLVSDLARHDVKIRTLPQISDIVSGKYLISHVREIEIDELLGRSSVPAMPELLKSMIEGRSIMVTGAGGSIGSDLCRLIVSWAPQRLVLLEMNEFALYQIERELSALGDLAIVPVLGSIGDEVLVRDTIRRFGVKVVFHAAAYKHVPLVEANALEGIKNNVLGTKVLTEVARTENVENFVLISSDKAVRPTNVMGATKRWAELIVWQAAQRVRQEGTKQKFCSVRFGNVLGSNGSVVPLFKEQIAKGGPVTITDPDMTRYFMSIHEAAELIVQAGALSKGGDVFLLDMGEPILIRELAETMIKLAGFTLRDNDRPQGDIEIVTIGKRPGEKMFEELFYDQSSAGSTRHSKIMRAARDDISKTDVSEALGELSCALQAHDEEEARRILFDLIR